MWLNKYFGLTIQMQIQSVGFMTHLIIIASRQQSDQKLLSYLAWNSIVGTLAAGLLEESFLNLDDAIEILFDC